MIHLLLGEQFCRKVSEICSQIACFHSHTQCVCNALIMHKQPSQHVSLSAALQFPRNFCIIKNLWVFNLILVFRPKRADGRSSSAVPVAVSVWEGKNLLLWGSEHAFPFFCWPLFWFVCDEVTRLPPLPVLNYHMGEAKATKAQRELGVLRTGETPASRQSGWAGMNMPQ
jgi:hypothetical protein